MLGLGSAAPPGAVAAPPRSFYGVSPQLVPTTAELARMAQGRIGTLRIQLSWAAVEPEPPDSLGPRYDFTRLDALIADAARNGIQVLPFFFSTPPWVATELDGRTCAEDCYFYAPESPEALDVWARFVGDVVGRYGRGGSFWAENPDLPEHPIVTWQIWNEQNSPTFYRPQPDVIAYADLLSRATAAIRARDPAATILLGGMFGTPFAGTYPAVSAWGFLRRLYRVPGAAESFDGVAPHPYAGAMDGVREQMRRFRVEMKRAGDAATGLWVTEIGWSSGGSPNPLNRGPRGQAKRLSQSFAYFRRNRRRLRLRNVTWYSWRDNSTGSAGACGWCPRSGLFAEHGMRAKPAWEAYVGFTGGS